MRHTTFVTSKAGRTRRGLSQECRGLSKGVLQYRVFSIILNVSILHQPTASLPCLHRYEQVLDLGHS